MLGGYNALGVAGPNAAGLSSGDYIQNVMVAATVGGLAATLGGGKFANGAKATAFLLAMRGLPAVYKIVTGYELDLSPGGAAVEKGPTGAPVQGANNIGTQGV